MEPEVVLAVVAVGWAAGAAVLRARRKRRHRGMAAWATSRSLDFQKVWLAGPLRRSPDDEFSRFKLFQHGRTSRTTNVAMGRIDGFDVRVFDYRHILISGRGKRAQTYTVCIVDGPSLHDVHFFCRRQAPVFDAIGKAFGGQDIDFVHDEAFSDAFVLQTRSDEQQLRSFLHPRLRATLTAFAPDNIVLEVVGGTLVLHRARRLAPDELGPLVDAALRIRRCFP
jgi:hypothetical protein